MKRTTIIITCLALTLSVLAQNDSIDNRKLKFQIYSGVAATKHQRIVNTHGGESYFIYGFGVRYGNPENNRIYPSYTFDRLSYRSFVVKDKYLNVIQDENSLRMNTHTLALNFPIVSKNTNNLIVIIGVNLGNQKEDSLSLDNLYYGYKLGMAYEKKMSKSIRYYLGIDYDINNATPNNRNMPLNGSINDFILSDLQNIRWFRFKFGILF